MIEIPFYCSKTKDIPEGNVHVSNMRHIVFDVYFCRKCSKLFSIEESNFNIILYCPYCGSKKAIIRAKIIEHEQ
jgi:DNA-directed RNA polymerase subunit RPC12/RpoP